MKIVFGFLTASLVFKVISYMFVPNDDPSLKESSLIHSALSSSERQEKNIPSRREHRVDCSAIINGDMLEIKKAEALARKLRQEGAYLTAARYRRLCENCSEFLLKRGYVTSPLTPRERGFPIAYSILVAEDIEMAERLLRAIYRPQNYYCVHVDLKASEVNEAFVSMSSCLPNLVIPERRVSVEWGKLSVLEAELQCMETLWPRPAWKYFINLTGKEFPLKTNAELVEILIALQGANDVHGTLKETYRENWRFPHRAVWFRPMKGSTHVTLSRAFVDFVLHNKRARDVFKWVTTLKSFHDEAFFSTLNHNPHLGAPGSYKGNLELTEENKPHLSRYKVWNTSNETFCSANSWLRHICILSIGDLPLMVRSVKLFANKFSLQDDRLAISCLEEWLYNSTLNTNVGINTSYYSNLDFVKNQVR
ncbi:beta-1,3-galactosyl-O-glycosyl-glycoprotein beta-1,6-N-acetylglucosaminyltransferase-like isoform X2 [Physella acuta]|nr:beta-1,3-galactosyl-O-glycosyl-glycoprotein beta-1,6-N-acetylglucosaminyltransferase-like isoform X2 [Physella acuta]